MKIGVAVWLGAIVLFAGTLSGLAQAGPDAEAARLLQRGHVDESVALLQAHLSRDPSNAMTHLFLCRAAYAEEAAEIAVNECQKAVALQPADGTNELWLGRALGLKARGSVLQGMSLAKQVRAAFEKAVQLGPGDVHAATDLGQFYVEAPSIVGGDPGKAQRLAEGLAAEHSWQSHRLLGLVAAKRGDLPAAERELRASIAAGGDAEATITLAVFLEQHGRPDDAVAAVRQALALDKGHGPVRVDAASILTETRRAPELAERALREYLAGNAQTEDAPAFKAEVQLGKLLAKRGDRAGAQQHYAAAIALAKDYAPARKALDGRWF